MTVAATIEHKLRATFSPAHLAVINESGRHAVPPGSETHFKVVVVSTGFAGQPRVRRHQAVNRTLAEELQGPVHALSIEAWTPEEWSARGAAAKASPPCLGGSKAAG